MAEDLYEFLRKAYPEADSNILDYYLKIIINHEEEKLPPTKKMREFVELHKAASDRDKELESLKAEILDERKRLDHKFQLVNISKVTGKKFSPEQFYKWVSTLVTPETLEDLTIRTIDEKKFMMLESKGIIEYDYIPKECYTDTEQWRVSVSRSKVDNDEVSRF